MTRAAGLPGLAVQVDPVERDRPPPAEAQALAVTVVIVFYNRISINL